MASDGFSKYGAFIIECNGGYERSAHVHRCKSYKASLKNNWAYKKKPNKPKLKNSTNIYDNSDYEKILAKIESRFVILF
tara:strand:- start:441 stop:677 length:237 start_codon:yes stop_codon:yes gene_type:complete